MTTALIKNEEGRLLNLINCLSALAWQKYQQRFPFGETGIEDRSSFPPFISFRFEKEDPDVVKRLLTAVSQYSGAVEWMMVSHNRMELPGVNWMICPKKAFELREKAWKEEGIDVYKYLAIHEPNFGPVAYQDLLLFTKYMYDFFEMGSFLASQTEVI